MSTPDAPKSASPLAEALVAFQKAQELMLSTHRKLKGASQEDTDRFWAGTGARLEQHLRACATAVVDAYKSFSAAGGMPRPVTGVSSTRRTSFCTRLMNAEPCRPSLIPERNKKSGKHHSDSAT